jgi:hypothetical protein
MLTPLLGIRALALSCAIGTATLAQCGWSVAGQLTPPAQHSTSSLLHFARSLALDSGRVIAGSPGYSPTYPTSGLASISTWDGTQWTLDAILGSSVPIAGDDYGRAVALAGDLAVVGAPLHAGTGAVFVYRRGADSTWIEEALWTGSTGSGFGSAVAICGARVVVAAPLANVCTVYEPGPTGWWLSATLAPVTDDAPPIGFGQSLAASADRLAVGYANDEHVAIYQLTDGAWTMQAELGAPEGFEDDGFGSAVALAGDRLLVGAPGTDDDPGAAFAFEYQLGEWRAVASIQPPPGFLGAEFGRAVSLSEQGAMVGAPHTGGGLGAAFVIEPTGSWPIVAQVLPKPTSAKGQFGGAVATDGTAALASIGLDEIGLFGYSGAQTTYVGGAWTLANESNGCLPYLLGYPDQLSVALGGEHSFLVSAGSAGAGSLYWILGSASGEMPGVAFGPLLLPLNHDAYFDASVGLPNQSIFSDTLGVTGIQGTSYAAIVLPPGLVALAGMTLHHSVAVLAPSGTLEFSAASSLTLVP